VEGSLLGFHRDLTPEAAASVLGGNLVYVKYRSGQWVGIVELQKIEEAKREFSDAVVFHLNHP
jgi:hypothetical protein